MDKKYYDLSSEAAEAVRKLKGPVIVLGAGGFIGVNLLKSLLLYRNDVTGISQDHVNNWRLLAANVPQVNLYSCDINDYSQLKEMVDALKPQTVFNLAAYGAYSKQKEYKKIYHTNFNSSVDLIELLKQKGFSCYIHAGSSAEYGLNSAAPKEETELIPNSHYAVSKAAMSLAIKYYGEIENLPVFHLRLYSAFGPWEEPDRLLPILLSKARHGELPPLVQPQISRDFIYVTDVAEAFIKTAASLEKFPAGSSFNIGTGKKTTIRDLVNIVRTRYHIEGLPVFGNMANRNWDLSEWFSDPQKAEKFFGWKANVSLESGLDRTLEWQKEVDFDNAFWNWTVKR